VKNLLIRIRSAVAAFKAAKTAPYYAVIYDEFEGDPDSGELIREEYYESFGSPEQAAAMYRDAFPTDRVNPDGRSFGNARLVMVMGNIDNYQQKEIVR